ncbi:L-rhamnose mutarotase [Nakamurella sp. YIM 132087]|uniref:L-rhamnose mutarotase n=1 Tax=Nakamurella alba TaxID=2665158 RepID=A0A7K1FN86_9ACTN|nr:L-rhamnose mutarotase [Nakamurella alba]MTD14779.1 L-rhamnose mutarotase [Nakamurella alba]
MSERVCFLMQVRADRLEEYLTVHETVWAEMLQALSETGWRNYSLFVRKPDGLVVGYLETDDYAAAQRRMAETDVNTRWQATMAPYFEGLDGPDGQLRPDEGSLRLEEYFHLD